MGGRFGGLVRGVMAGNGLGQDKTNGKSKWGTLLAPLIPYFLGNGGNTKGAVAPWGSRDTQNTCPYTQYPTTGVVRNYDFTVSRGMIAPDGYLRDVLLVNGAYPGPLIEANWGDVIQVTVHNNITGPEEGTALHWHGFLQKGTPWEDGAPAITQCPISPGKTYTYRFEASLYGSSWYHSHYSAQYSGGVLGPIIVHGPTKLPYDIDVGPVMLSDWYHKSYFDIIAKMLAPGGDPKVFSDNNLINGKGTFDCSTKDAGDNTPCTNNAGIAKFKFTTGKTHRLRLVNSGSEGVQRFSIDGHTMTVFANDFVPIEAYDTKVVTLGVGQRADVIVKANVGKTGSVYWVRSELTSCSPAKKPLALAAVYYDKDTGATPTTTAWDVPDPGTCANDDLALTKPLYKMALPKPSFTKTFDIETFVNASDVSLWKFDGVSFRGDYNSPTLLLAKAGNLTFPEIWNVKNLGSNTSVRIIVENKTPAAHPIHLHGHNFYVLHEGDGTWDGTSIVNANNPMRRDVQMVRGNGHLVIQFDSNNPGVWPFHCHIAWHASGGFFSQLVVQPDKIRSLNFPSTSAQLCRDWALFTKTTVPDQIDSGL